LENDASRAAMSRTFAFEVRSRLASPAKVVWAHATSMRGVNAELFPLVRMTHPRGLDSLAEHEVPLGARAFRSWILLAGIVPIDFDDLTFVALEPGRFLERSPMLTQREWEHERRVEPSGAGCVVTDRIRSVPRVAALAPLFGLVFRLAFALRHRNLRRRFGIMPP
jgi:ligand-binding SRPBCC domain-containing protein